jgi:uncharacterized protein YaiL (DUF2058 family)
MGDLRDALKKAGLIGDKDAKRLAHEERVDRKQLGREGLEQQRQRDEADRQRRDEQRKADTKAAQQKLDAQRAREERWKRLVQQLDEQAQRATSGPRRFHYHEPDGHLPFVLVDDESGRRLEAGELALVRLPSTGEVALAPRALALELTQIEPERVVHLAGTQR